MDIPSLPLEMEQKTVNDSISQLIGMQYVKRKSEFIRLMKQGGIQMNGEKIGQDALDKILINGDVIKIGKKKFVKISK